MNKPMWRPGLLGAAVTAAVVGGIAAAPVRAMDFKLGALDAAFDTDLTWGLSMRTAEPDRVNQGAYGNRYLFDDRWGIFSNAVKGSHTFEAKGDGYGGLLRGNWFYDFEMANQGLPDAAENRAVQHGDITDAYVYKRFGADDNLSVRLGKQVISWGESTFIGGALSDINTVDISKLRTPGADLKDAFLGTPAIDISYNFLENWTLEGFYLFGFDETKTDPMGSFFTGLDAIADGGGFDYAGNGVIGGGCLAPDFPGGSPALYRCDLLGGALVRAGDDLASKWGQWGAALRVFLPNFGNGGEVALYYQNLHDHAPAISGFVGTGRFFLEYPENIDRWGMSFNTNVAGLALSGEYSYRHNAPMQMTLPLLLSAVRGGPFVPYHVAAFGATSPVGQEIRGYEGVDRHQVQFTVNKNWGVMQAIGADAFASVAEVMWGWLGGLPDAAPIGGPLAGGAASAYVAHSFTRFTNFEPAVTDHYGKFVMRHSMTFESALFNLVALEPSLAFSWDFNGYSNEVGGGKLVVEGKKALTLGLGFLYGGGTWTGGINYTTFWGEDDDLNAAGSRLNGTNDRDFLSFNVSYSF